MAIVEHNLRVYLQNISDYGLSNMLQELHRCIVELKTLSMHDQYGNHIWLYFLEIEDTYYRNVTMKCQEFNHV